MKILNKKVNQCEILKSHFLQIFMLIIKCASRFRLEQRSARLQFHAITSGGGRFSCKFVILRDVDKRVNISEAVSIWWRAPPAAPRAWSFVIGRKQMNFFAAANSTTDCLAESETQTPTHEVGTVRRGHATRYPTTTAAVGTEFMRLKSSGL